MKTLTIERVSNGWIVRPFTGGCGWPVADLSEIFVYRTTDGPIKDLPALLGEKEPACGFCEKPVEPTDKS